MRSSGATVVFEHMPATPVRCIYDIYMCISDAFTVIEFMYVMGISKQNCTMHTLSSDNACVIYSTHLHTFFWPFSEILSLSLHLSPELQSVLVSGHRCCFEVEESKLQVFVFSSSFK